MSVHSHEMPTATERRNPHPKGYGFFEVRPRVRQMLSATAVMLLIGCASETSVAVPVADAVRINGAQPLVVGDSSTLTATVTAKGAVIARPVAWTSSDPSVAAISSSGFVRAIARGSTIISATSGPVSSSATLTVLGVRSVIVTPAAVAIPITGGFFLTTRVDADAGVSAPVTWVSGNPNVATVSADGSVTGVALGTAIITATARGAVGTALVTVTPPPPPPLPPAISSRLNPGTLYFIDNLRVGQTVQLVDNWVVRTNSGVTVTYSYRSSDERAARISDSGLVSAVGASSGVVVLTITASGTGVGVNPNTILLALRLAILP